MADTAPKTSTMERLHKVERALALISGVLLIIVIVLVPAARWVRGWWMRRRG